MVPFNVFSSAMISVGALLNDCQKMCCGLGKLVHSLMDVSFSDNVILNIRKGKMVSFSKFLSGADCVDEAYVLRTVRW